jgi:glucose/arabinose dehydrogenase
MIAASFAINETDAARFDHCGPCATSARHDDGSQEEVMRRLGPISSLVRLPLVVIVAVSLLAVAVQAPTGTRAAAIRLVPVATGFQQPLFVTGAGTDNSRLFVVEKPGRIRVVEAGEVLETPFLDITEVVNDNANERGLLGLAFHPDYETNGEFFVHYNDASGDIVIAGYSVSDDDPNLADEESQTVILKIPHRKAANHNGGMLAFGPDDGYLYIAVGDGGAGQSANAQKKTKLLGKILRIDVDKASGGRAYGIPAGNPFAKSRKARPEIWAYGLRNPFRFSFDRQTGDMFIGDVGQARWEEIDFGPAGRGGRNYGWDIMEGRHCFNPPKGCDRRGLRLPIHEYSHKVGNVVTGGYVYRGTVTDLVGTYVFTDFGSRDIWGLTRNQQTGKWGRSMLFHSEDQLNIASFGESDVGELFAVDLVNGTLSRLEAA